MESLHEESAIEQKLYEVPAGQRLDAPTWLLSHYQPAGSCVVFCNTKRACNDVADHPPLGFGAGAGTATWSSVERDQVLVRFANGSATMHLVATDVAARGPRHQTGAVINYELTYDPGGCMCTASAVPAAPTSRPGPEPPPAERGPSASTVIEYRPRPHSPGGDPGGTPRHRRSRADGDPSIDAGRKSKVRAGDILGAPDRRSGIAGADVGKDPDCAEQ